MFPLYNTYFVMHWSI